MNWKAYVKPIAIQFVGQAVLGGLAWYWLSLGVSTTLLVAANALFAVGLVIGWSVLDAVGLQAPRNLLRAVPAVVLTPLMGLHVGLAMVIPFLWIMVLFPSVVAGRWKVMVAPGYVAVCTGMLLVMTVIPVALLNWIPAVSGLTGQLASFGLRGLLAYSCFAGGWAMLLRYISLSVAVSNGSEAVESR